ncbi:MAG: peptidoglycan DD-metalloendopeptidase family protein [Bacteroidota bacterium]|nr:peptidoglycan DD-metalloendopeptidase family protein [Bacteroidota bacterium]
MSHIRLLKYLSFVFIFFLFSCKKEKKSTSEEQEIESPKPKTERFGFILEDYLVINDTIEQGDTFSNLLNEHGFSSTEIHNIVSKVKDSLNLKNIRAGRPFTVLKSLHKPHTVQAIIYQPDIINYSVIDFRGGINAYNKQRPVTIKRKIIVDTINNSLSSTLNKNGVSAALTHNLSQIYAWSVNFFKIQKGDAFGIIFNERYVNDSIYVGIESIEGAFFLHKGKKIYAFPFKRDSLGSSEEYFDENGKGLKSMFLKAPLKFSRITSKFSPRRFHPVQKTWKPHNGTDYAAPHGTPIMTTAHGVVEATGYTSGNGNFVKVKHNNTYATQYLHMSRIAVKKGQRVSQGDVIGYVGSTGLATGPHVCYRFWKNGVQVDPLKQDFQNSEPLENKYKNRFLKQIDPVKFELDSVSKNKLNI